MFTTWIQDNKSARWRDGPGFVQLMKNGSYLAGIKASPYDTIQLQH